MRLQKVIIHKCPYENTILGGEIGIQGIGEYNLIFKNLPFVFNWTNGSAAISNESIDELLSVVDIRNKSYNKELNRMKINFPKSIILFSLILFNLVVPNMLVLGQNEKRIELVNIEFIGNDYFDTSELENIIISKESSWWGSQFFNSFTSFGSPATYFDSLDIEDDIEILQNYYKSNGFFKAQITHEYKITKSKKSEASLKYLILWKMIDQQLESMNLNGFIRLTRNIIQTNVWSN